MSKPGRAPGTPSAPLPEWLGVAALGAVAAFFLATSWRRWTDPLIDFGRELYLPWRLSQGAVLYRDVDDFYGPLSQYLNAGLFRVFGPGLMVLVAANLAVFGVVTASVYALFRRAWGAGPALASCALFISVFGFSQFYGANHNYATPYSHEATHGLLACLLLALVLLGWLARPRPTMAAASGLLLGLASVLKPEILLAAALVTAAALALALARKAPSGGACVAAWAAGAALPTLAFWAYFASKVPAADALGYACRGWTTVVASRRFTGDVIQATFLGIDRPWTHLAEHALASLSAATLAALAVMAARLTGRRPPSAGRLALVCAASAVLTWLAWTQVDWLESGRCLLGLALPYAAWSGWRALRCRGGSPADRQAARWLTAVLAASLMARMALNGRIYQFGFYQAALAAVLLPALLVGEIPEAAGLGSWGRGVLAALTLLPIGAGVVRLAARSQGILAMKTFPVGDGLDRFFDMPPRVEATGAVVDRLSRALARIPGHPTLLVLPEGEMVNYLARMPSPVAPFFFFSAATRDGREDALVAGLQRSPPDWVAIVSRDLREYGIARYGEKSGEGREILAWVGSHYREAGTIGGDPLDTRQRGAVILSRER